MSSVLLWRDAHDRDHIVIGTRLGDGRVAALLTGHVDALQDIAGMDVYQQVIRSADDQFPLPIELKFTWAF